MFAAAIDPRLLDQAHRGDAIAVTFPSDSDENYIVDALRLKVFVEWMELGLADREFFNDMLAASEASMSVWPDESNRTIVFIKGPYFRPKVFVEYLRHAINVTVVPAIPVRSPFYRNADADERYTVGQMVFRCNESGEPEGSSVKVVSIENIGSYCTCGEEATARSEHPLGSAQDHSKDCQVMRHLVIGHSQILALKVKGGFEVRPGCRVTTTAPVSKEQKKRVVASATEAPQVPPEPEVPTEEQLQQLLTRYRK